jgi:succinyl-diaminopimelate desuccinylase
MAERQDFPTDVASLREAAAGSRQDVLDFCRDLVRIPSPSGEEEAAAHRTVAEMEKLGLDEVRIDRAGNVLGLLRANHPEPLEGAVMLNAHLDIVDVGDVNAWPFPPFEGHVEDGRLHGRGATDTKSAVAGQVHAAGLLARLCRESGLLRRRDLVVAAVVQEEVGGLGTSCLVEDGPLPAVAVIGEPSLGGLSFGHRGRVEVEVGFHGKAAHASRPDWGLNPHPSLAAFIQILEQVERNEDPQLGPSSVAPTLVSASPKSPNVIPSLLALTLDWRNVPGELPEEIRARVLALAEQAAVDGVQVTATTPTKQLRSWSGVEKKIERISRPFSIDPEGACFQGALSALTEGLGRAVEVLAWDFASDGGWLHAAGVPCLGYGPGEMRVMHAVNESVSVELLQESPLGYALLALSLDGDLG